MAKRLLFVGVVIVTLSSSSITSAGMLDWLEGLWPQKECVNQQQSSSIDMTQMTAKAGPGTAYSTNSVPCYQSTQSTTTRSGTKLTQGVNFSGFQTSCISGGCGSCGATYQNISVNTCQSQSVR